MKQENLEKVSTSKDQAITMLDLANDVLKLLEAKKIFAETGCLISGEWENKHVQNLETCYVCAKGALLVAHADIKQETLEYPIQYITEQQNDRLNFEDYFAGIATYRQLSMIEAAFELTDFNWRNITKEQDPTWEEDMQRAVNWGKSFDYETETTERLKAIMENIIENNGIFKP